MHTFLFLDSVLIARLKKKLCQQAKLNQMAEFFYYSFYLNSFNNNFILFDV